MNFLRSSVFSAVGMALLAGVLHGQSGVIVTLSTSSTSFTGGGTANLQALVTGSNLGVTWGCTSVPTSSQCNGLGPGAGPTNGLWTNTFTVQTPVAAHVAITITAKSITDPTQVAAVQISVSPASISIQVVSSDCSSLILTLTGTPQTCHFQASVFGTSQTAVTWSINSSTGSIDPNLGVYTSPASVSASTKITVTATLTADGKTTGTATLTLQPVPVESIAISPTTATLTASASQTFTATITNGLNSNTPVWIINPSLGTLIDNKDGTATYTAPAQFAAGQTVKVIATTNDTAAKSATATVTLQSAPTVTVTVSPSTASLTPSQTVQFAATVTNSTVTTVNWSISPPGLGVIDNTGFYTAPSSITTQQTVTVSASSTVSPSSIGTATVTLKLLVDVGTGAPTIALQQEFVQAFYRGSFNTLVALPPQGNVASLGGGVLGQKFSDAAKDSGITYALVTASPTLNPAPGGSNFPIAQMYPAIFAYYSTIGATSAGYPLSDTLNCPFFDPNNTCTYQEFDKNYLLVAYANALSNGTVTVDVTSTFFTEWNTLGAISGPGLPTAASATITAGTGTTASAQAFTRGEIFSITSGANKGQMYGVVEPIFDLYQANGGSAGSLGLPTGNAITLTSGLVQQTFEGGTLQFTTSGGGTVLLPVGSVVLTGVTNGQTFTLTPGQTMTISATVFSTTGLQLTNRYISWISTNPNVVTVQSNGASATVTAVSGGSATVLAQSGGISSGRVTFVVTTACCQVGDGAPQAVVSEFLTALSRNQITPQLPIPDPASPSANGYVQTVQSVSSAGVTTTYLVTAASSSITAYVVTGALLAAYQNMGGPAGPLGYPLSDSSAGGTQLFANGALGGSPIHLVSGAILAKWQSLGYETGAAGPPAGDAIAFTTIDADSGVAQSFAQGTIYAATGGPRTGQAYFVFGMILAAYSAAGGISGSLGMPTGDAVVAVGAGTQNFEGGSIAYAAGASTATVTAAPKVPAVVVAPAAVSAGGHVVFAITGFPNNHTIRVSQTGQPDFLVTTATGAYTWDTYLSLASPSATLTITAADTSGTATANGTLVVRSLAASRAGLTKVQGDNQTGMPGAALPLPLVVSLADSSGAPMTNVAVTFQASAGAMLSATSAVTDGTGRAQTSVRLQASTGVALVTASVPAAASAAGGSSLVTFGAISAPGSLPGFPALQQSGAETLGHGTATVAQKGALLTAVSGILQYHQNRGEVPSPNGQASPAALNSYLTSFCAPGANPAVCDGFLSNGASGEQIVNLWRAAQFTGGLDVTVLNPALTAVADLVAQGEPVLLSLGLANGTTPVGGNFVVAVGVSADGSLVIQDPNPLFARGSLTDYLNGFAAGGSNWTGTVLGAIRFAVRGPSAKRFLVGALSQPAALMAQMTLNISSPAGNCGTPVQFNDTVDSQGNPPANGALVSLLSVCDGTQSSYEVDIGLSQAYQAFATDLTTGGPTFNLSGNVVASYVLTRAGPVLAVAPLQAGLAANGIVNAASFTSGLAPGGIMAIFGIGLSGTGSTTVVTVDGVAATVLFASPFQINAQMPAVTTPGSHMVQVKSPHGTVQQQVTVSAAAPAIFILNAPSEGAVLNQDYSINNPTNPVLRGQSLLIYATGLGSTVTQGQYSATSQTVTAVVNGTEQPVSFSGLAPGFIGLYQVNVLVPSSIPPGSAISFALKEGGQLSNSILVAIQ